MPLPGMLLRQFARPAGILARVAAHGMNLENHDLNMAAVDMLRLEPGERVLDIGFGGGVAFEPLLDAAGPGNVAGIDVSPEMVTLARKQRGDAIDVREGSVTSLPWPDDSFDAVLTVNALHFWGDLPPAFAEVRRILKPGGRVALGMRYKETLVAAGFSAHGWHTPTKAELVRTLETAAFVDLDHRAVEDGTGGLVTLARRAA